MTGEVIPFGKYRGQPVEILAADREYVDWLTAQPWFRERYGNIYTLIVNNFGEPAETPEHNALQALFLDERFAASVFEIVHPGLVEKEIKSVQKDDVPCKVNVSSVFEVGGFDVAVYVKILYKETVFYYEIGRSKTRPEIRDCFINFIIYVEIKPTVGDEYPAVIRQIDNNIRALYKREELAHRDIPVGKCCLFLKEYTGVGVTEEQFIAIFKNSGIKVIFLRDVT